MGDFKPIKTISILGCGWLGTAIGKRLIELGFTVKGSTRSEEKIQKLKDAGFQPYLINLLPEGDEETMRDFLDSDLMISCIPPQNEDHMETFHAQQIKFVRDVIEDLPIDKVIYISSTGVYPLTNKEVNENADTDKENKTARALVHAEEVFRINTKLDATILRCGGLMGYDRIPGKYFAGQKGLTTGEMPVNYVHRDEVVNLIEYLINKNDHNSWNKVFNVVAPMHPPRKALYLQNAKDFGFEAPEFVNNPKPRYKIINSDKIVHKAGYTFIHPDPMKFEYEG